MEQAITSWLLTVEVLDSSPGQSMRDLWLTNEQWKRFYSEYFSFPVSVISTNAAASFIHSFIHRSQYMILATDGVVT